MGKSGERDQFKQQARSCVMEWRDRTFNSPCIDDPHYLTFSPYEPKVHEPVRQAMMTDARKLEQEEEEVNDRLHKLPVFKLFKTIHYKILTTRLILYIFRYEVETVYH